MQDNIIVNRSLADEITYNAKLNFIINDIHGVEDERIIDPFMGFSEKTQELLFCLKNQTPLLIDISDMCQLDEVIVNILCKNNMISIIEELQAQMPNIYFETDNGKVTKFTFRRPVKSARKIR